MTIRRLVQLLVGTLVVLAAITATLIVRAALNRADLVRLQEQRFRSYELADELRHTSDDLTRFAQTYVASGDPKFEAAYRQVLAIRNGDAPRPLNYERAYWDLAIARGTPGPVGPPVALRTLMQEAGFTPAELEMLQRAQSRSDSLVNIEETALHAVRGEFRDAAGGFTRKAAPDRALGLRIMFDSTYHRQKGRIMAPIDSFLAAVQVRTASELVAFQQDTRIAFIVLETFLALFLLVALASYPILRSRILVPVEALQVQTGAMAADIENLAETATRTARGEATSGFKVQTAEVRSTRPDEVGDLSRRYDAVLALLQQTGSGIATLTSQLRNANEELNRNVVDLERARKKLQDILDGSPVAVAITVNGVVRYANPRMTETVGAVVGKQAGSQYVNEADRTTLMTAIRDHGSARDMVIPFKGSTGGVIETLSSFYTIDVDGEPGVLGWIVDITELKRIENELRDSYVQLQSLERLRDELAQMIVHDMRGLLTVVIANLDLARGELTGQPAEDVADALSAAEAVNRMANTVLYVSRLEEGKMPVRKEPTNLSELAEQTVRTFGAIDRRRTLVCVAQGPVISACDADLVRRVIENLVSNAVKHTPEGGNVTVDVTLMGDRARVAVEDDGRGIPEEMRSRLFEKFAAARKESKFHSAGLGLAFCRLAIEAHGGVIRVEAGSPKGSVFAFEIPT